MCELLAISTRHPVRLTSSLKALASVPLTDEAWRPMPEGEVIAIRNGEIISTRNL